MAKTKKLSPHQRVALLLLQEHHPQGITALEASNMKPPCPRLQARVGELERIGYPVERSPREARQIAYSIEPGSAPGESDRTIAGCTIRCGTLSGWGVRGHAGSIHSKEVVDRASRAALAAFRAALGVVSPPEEEFDHDHDDDHDDHDDHDRYDYGYGYDGYDYDEEDPDAW